MMYTLKTNVVNNKICFFFIYIKLTILHTWKNFGLNKWLYTVLRSSSKRLHTHEGVEIAGEVLLNLANALALMIFKQWGFFYYAAPAATQNLDLAVSWDESSQSKLMAIHKCSLYKRQKRQILMLRLNALRGVRAPKNVAHLQHRLNVI